MPYRSHYTTKDIEVKIPLHEIDWLITKFHFVRFDKDWSNGGTKVSLAADGSEDHTTLDGKLINGFIILDKEQSGGLTNADEGDNGLGLILTRFKGSGTVERQGEETGDNSVEKYEKGVIKIGKVVFE